MKKGVSKYDIYLESIIKLNASGMTTGEISKQIGIDSRRVSDILKKQGLKSNSKNENIKPKNTIQEQIILGSIIGDGCLFRSGKGEKCNYRLNVAHSLKQKQYMEFKYNSIKDMINSKLFIKKQFHNKAKKEYTCISFQSVACPYYTELYNIWYKEGKKIIPKEISQLDELGLAIKFFDDGYKEHNGLAISMCDYDEESINNFMKILYKKFNISTNLHSNKNIYIPAKEKNSFKDIVIKYSTPDVLYKLG